MSAWSARRPSENLPWRGCPTIFTATPELHDHHTWRFRGVLVQCGGYSDEDDV
ncbi:hypothetical protein [Streptomyces sp. NPDC056796]|uniref:hypothetical protein n=1 Tax=Streptomyces sp. NPDC056796 TaxID=3345947 RepID=UPI00368270A4